MDIGPLATMKATRSDGIHRGGCIMLAVLSAFLFAPAAVFAAGESSSGAKSKAVSFESIEGSKVKRVILTERAVQRLGIETGKVDEERIVRKQIVGGVFIAPSTVPPALTASTAVAVQPAAVSAPTATEGSGGTLAAFTLQRSVLTPPAIGEGLVRVMFSLHEWERLAQDQPARILRLAPRSGGNDVLLAKPSGMPPAEDIKRSMLTYFYVVDTKEHGLEANERVRVELQLADSGGVKKVVPYSAVYYDAKGEAWVYTNPKPLVYERKQIKVEHIIGDKAALLDGPDVGASVVTVGAALLYGAERYGK
jgi:hypothetical protein